MQKYRLHRIFIDIIIITGFATVNEVYASYFCEPYPARSCVEVAALPKGVLLEVEAIAGVI